MKSAEEKTDYIFANRERGIILKNSFLNVLKKHEADILEEAALKAIEIGDSNVTGFAECLRCKEVAQEIRKLKPKIAE